MEFPKYQVKDLIVGNLESNVGVVTLWTEKTEVAKHLDKKNYCVIGQLYSVEGVNYLIRNCLANKNIRYIVMLGEDISGTGDVLELLFDGVVVGEHRIGNTDIYLDEEIQEDAIFNFLENVQLLDYRNKKDFSEINKYIAQLNDAESYGEPEIFPEKKIEFPHHYPSERVGFIVREESIGDAWLKLLQTIMRYGIHKESSYSDDQIELLDLMTVTNEPMDFDRNGLSEIDFKDYYLFSKEHLEEYYDQIISAKPYNGINYTYGQRLRSHFDVDQIAEIIDELKKEKFSRRAVAITWDVKIDHDSSHAPCLDLVQCNIQDNKLYLTAYIRSNDMVKAWVENAYGLRRLQKFISVAIGVPMGTLITISNSAHIYESDISIVEKLITRNVLVKYDDPRGNFIIDTSDDLINLQLLDNGKVIDQYSGDSAEAITIQLYMNNVISNPYHAMYLGRELQRAELRLKI